ncbi:MAG: phosphoenolpyruvate--protein phosphotransferase [bacterium]|nr:phosphoenolpyruvate--protein phosphotransferase [bacterium]
METFQGIGAADGIAIGAAVCISTRIGDIYQIPLPSTEIDAEIARFQQAVESSRQEIGRLRDRVGTELGDELAGIFDAQALVLSDSSFLEGVHEHIRREHVNAEWALQETVGEIQARFDEIDSQHLRDRQEDLRHVCRYVIRSLRGIHLHQLSEVQGDVVIVADDLSPSDAVRLGRENVIGFVIEHGSPTSHTTIIARSLNLPLVLGVGGISHKLADQVEMPILVDGTAGSVVLHPDARTIESYRQRRRERQLEEQRLLAASELPPVTLDGTEIQVMANIDLPEELDDVRRYAAAGIGLYRSEFLYIERSPELPSEEEHLAIYRKMIEAAAPNPAIIRTYDLGGRKIAREVMETQENNPVLGLRGIRLTLARPDIFLTQLRALIRATVYGDLWIMLPLVTIPEEILEFRRVAEGVMEQLEREELPFRRDFKLGIMVEVPAAALITDILARYVDFFSIGTNDLIQYALAVDRSNEHVADLYRPLHPGMLRMLRLIVRNAAEAGIEVSICGEMAADARMTAVLLGCGLRRLSVSPRRVPTIKRRVRELSVEKLEEMAETCSNLATAVEVNEYLRAQLGESVENATA